MYLHQSLIMVLDNKQSRADEFYFPSKQRNVLNRLVINLCLVMTSDDCQRWRWHLVIIYCKFDKHYLNVNFEQTNGSWLYYLPSYLVRDRTNKTGRNWVDILRKAYKEHTKRVMRNQKDKQDNGQEKKMASNDLYVLYKTLH
jgi:hypothetical protein